MTRLWPDGSPLDDVQLSTEQPRRFTWQGQPHPVAAIHKRWRIQADWWHEATWRDYFKLSTATGLLVIIYHDLQTGEWYLQRLYD